MTNPEVYFSYTIQSSDSAVDDMKMIAHYYSMIAHYYSMIAHYYSITLQKALTLGMALFIVGRCYAELALIPGYFDIICNAVIGK